MSILVVGSVAYDTVETPFGRAERVLGGSASFFSVAASFFTPVNLVGVVGDDFGEEQLAAFRGRPIDLEGLERMEGKTFHWQGRYSLDLNSRDTICTDLNVFEFFKPKIPARYRGSEVVFLGNIDPVLQRQVLDQVERPRVVACDTMNFWIHGKPEELREDPREGAHPPDQRPGGPRAQRRVEPREGGARDPRDGAAHARREEGRARRPHVLRGGLLRRAGAAARGGVRPHRGRGHLRRAASSATSRAPGRRATPPCAGPSIMGSTLASFCVEAFSLDRLLKLTRPRSTPATATSRS